MPYSVELDAAGVRDYLRNCEGLSREFRIALYSNLDLHLRENGDILRKDPMRRLTPGSPYFSFDLLLGDFHADRIHQFWFVVDDSAAEYGVLRVVYVEERTG